MSGGDAGWSDRADISRSRSPALHLTEARTQGLALDYQLIDLTARGLGPEALPDLLDEAEAAGFVGLINATPVGMAVFQAVAAFELFTGRPADAGRMSAHFAIMAPP